MNIQIELPENLERTFRHQFGDTLQRRAKEDLAAKWFSEGRLTSGQVAGMLAVSWVEAQGLLKARGGSR